MITNVTVKKVIELLREGKWSQRQIAKMTGVSRGSVGAIARGARKEPRFEAYEEDKRIIPPSGTPTRCHCCGRLVQKPCLACQIRTIPKRNPNGNISFRQMAYDG